MKAIRVTAPGVAETCHIPDLNAAPPHHVLLRVNLVGMCGSDLNTFRGRNPMAQLPRILGHEVAATVAENGPELNGSALAPGTLVTLAPYTHCGACASCLRRRYNACQFNQTMGVQRDGAMAEWIAVPRERLYTANLSSRELCLVEPLTVGAHAVARGRVTAGDTVAIFGCGGVGLGAIAASAFTGARTIAIDMDDAKLAIARKAGAAHTINTASQDLHTGLAELTNGRGPDVVIEAIGLPATFRAAVEEAAFTGRVVYIGYAKEPVAYETRLFVQKELDILGSRNALPADFQFVIRMLESGTFPANDAVSIIIPPEEAPRLLAEWSENPARFTKIMIQFS